MYDEFFLDKWTEASDSHTKFAIGSQISTNFLIVTLSEE